MEAPPVITTVRPRFPWLLTMVVIAAATALAAVFFLFDPSHNGFYPRCMMYTTTGFLCPGCGSQRALHQLFHGHLVTALRCNVLFVLGLPILAVVLFRHGRDWIRTGIGPAVKAPTIWLTCGIVIVVVFTVLRNIPCAPFNFLTPP